jgi:Holliday junction resolvase RusA-like endonuclease
MTGPLLRIVAHGIPAPQGSKRGFVNKHTGRVVMREQSTRLEPWRDTVRHEALAVVGGYGAVDRIPPLDEPVVVDAVFTFARPRSHYRTGRNAHLLRDGAPARPDGPPDLSKLARAIEDSLSDAGVWRDDARVVEYGRLAKVYAGEDGDALDRPGVLIRVWRLPDLTPSQPTPSEVRANSTVSLFDPIPAP